MQNHYSTSILCGGRSLRMGEDKAKLDWKGKPLASHKWDQFNAGEDEDVFFSVRDGRQGEEIRDLVRGQTREETMADRTAEDAVIQTVPDIMPDRGPLCGVLSSLQYCREEILFVTAVDMPFSDRALSGELAAVLDREGPAVNAVIPVTADGRKHPLCAVYRKSCIPVLREQLSAGNYKVRDILPKLSVKFVREDLITEGAKKLTNMNDPSGYRAALEASVPVFSLIAWSDTGKTTYLEKLIPALNERGVRVAVIKHDGHDFDIDHEGTDSAKFTAAGANVSGIFSDTHAALMLNFPVSAESLISLVAMSGTADLIITEGCKRGKWPKILLYRQNSGKPMATDPDRCAAVVSDVRVDTAAPVFNIRDVETVAGFLMKSV